MGMLCGTSELGFCCRGGKSEHFKLQPPWKPTGHLCVLYSQISSAERQLVKPGLGHQKKQTSPDCILQDSKLSFPLFPGPLSEVGLMTLFSFIGFLLSAGMKREKKALYDSAGHWINTG